MMPKAGQSSRNKARIDKRNKINRLTGREWLYFLNSIEITAYPVSGPESYGHNLRKSHPSPKPPQLMQKFIEFFTKPGAWVFDPFVGVGGTLLGCSLCGRKGVGIDLSKEYIDIYKAVCAQEGLEEQITIVDDARNMDAHPEIATREFDFILTDPPYSNMMAKEKTGEVRKKTGQGKPTPFTSHPADLGNLPRTDFLKALREIIELSVSHLRPRGYLAIFCKDFQPTPKRHNMLHAEVVEELMKISHLTYRGYKIWHDKTINLYPFGYPYDFVANQLHQFILIFRKKAR